MPVPREQLLTPNYTAPRQQTANTHLARAALQVRLLHKTFPSKRSRGISAMAAQLWLWRETMQVSDGIWGYKASKLRGMPAAWFFVVDAPKGGLQRSQRALSAKVMRYISGY